MGIGPQSTGARREGRVGRPSGHADSGLSETLKPLLAGAQARGMADMLDLLGLGCIFIRADGGLLHVSERGKEVLDGVIVQAAGHLAGITPCSRSAIDRLLAGTLAGRACREVILTESHPIELQSYLPATAENAGVQLLYGVITVRRLA